MARGGVYDLFSFFFLGEVAFSRSLLFLSNSMAHWLFFSFKGRRLFFFMEVMLLMFLRNRLSASDQRKKDKKIFDRYE